MNPTQTGRIVSVNLSTAKGTIKKPVPAATADGHGLVGDAHAGPWHRQISLLARESVERFARESGRDYASGEFAENLTTEGLDLATVAIRDRLTVGERVELEVTQIGKTCHGGGCAVYQAVGACVMPKEGIFARVCSGGPIAAGDPIAHTPRPLRVRVIVLSDRASRGEYEDRGGPAVEQGVTAHFAGSRWRLDIARVVRPDDPAALREALAAARAEAADVIFTTGGTGIGPRDITPDVVAPLLDKTLPGIMEFVRVESGKRLPSALLSRGVAGIMGESLVFTLPGSVRAVREYLAAILPTVEHALLMLWGLDAH